MRSTYTYEDDIAFITYIRDFIAEHFRPGERFVFVPVNVYNAVKRLGPPGLTYLPSGIMVDSVHWRAHGALTPTLVDGNYDVPFALYCHKRGDVVVPSWVLNRPVVAKTLLPDQPPPTPGTGDLWRELIDSNPTWDAPRTIAMCEERRQIGIARYKTPLQRGNKRDFRTDLLQELLDAAVYAQGDGRSALAKHLIGLAADINDERGGR